MICGDQIFFTHNPKFLNIVIKVDTNLNPVELLKKCKKIESLLGRKKSSKNSPRICDIDILDYDQKVFKIENKNDFIYIPHPRLHQRSFVLLPLFEISRIFSLSNFIPFSDNAVSKDSFK